MQILLDRVIRFKMFIYISVVFIGSASIFIINHNVDDIAKDKHVIVYWEPIQNNITCHYSKDGDGLPAAEKLRISPHSKSIFFHETSCRGGLTSRQACSVESAARTHPHWQVYLLFSSPVSHYILNNTCIAKILQFPNVKIARVHIIEYCEGTNLDLKLLRKLKYSRRPIEKTAEFLSLATLSKWGGLYLDLDMLVIKSLENLGSNWIVKISDTEISRALISLGNDEVGRFHVSFIIKEALRLHDPYDWVYDDPDAIYSIVEDFCPSVLNSTADYCQGLKIYPRDKFFPIDYPFWYVYYGVRDLDDMENVYAHRLWSEYSQDINKIDKNSPYGRLARKYCPTIYNMYGENFGT